MNNQKIKLNPKVWDSDVELLPTRKGFGEGLLFVGEKNKNVVALCADLTESTQMHLFKNKFPNRFIEIGVAEQNLASVASGMSAMGKIPVISSYAMFSPGRNWEQIRTTICYNDRPVVIIGSHSGISVGPDGGTHQALEDIALTRVIPNMTVVSPCDFWEAKKAIIEAVGLNSPIYIRLTKQNTAVMTTEETEFQIGKASLFYGSALHKADCLIIATGPVVYEAIKTAKEIEDQDNKIKIKVLNLSTIKPLDDKTILDLVKECKAVVTVEEHQIFGGAGSACGGGSSTGH
jgi:transketolase